MWWNDGNGTWFCQAPRKAPRSPAAWPPPLDTSSLLWSTAAHRLPASPRAGWAPGRVLGVPAPPRSRQGLEWAWRGTPGQATLRTRTSCLGRSRHAPASEKGRQVQAQKPSSVCFHSEGTGTPEPYVPLFHGRVPAQGHFPKWQLTPKVVLLVTYPTATCPLDASNRGGV